jgi:hypothetical protein
MFASLRHNSEASEANRLCRRLANSWEELPLVAGWRRRYILGAWGQQTNSLRSFPTDLVSSYNSLPDWRRRSLWSLGYRPFGHSLRPSVVASFCGARRTWRVPRKNGRKNTFVATFVPAEASVTPLCRQTSQLVHFRKLVSNHSFQSARVARWGQPVASNRNDSRQRN